MNGKQVHIKPEYQDKGDDNFNWYVVEDNGERVKIVCDIPTMDIKPTSIVPRYMLDID